MPIELQLRLPGFDMMRMTNRAFHVGLVFAAWMAGAAVDRLVALAPGLRLRAAVASVVALLLVLDAGTAPRERRRMPIEDDLPAIYRAVRALPDDVLYERTDELDGAAEALYFSIFHGKRLVNGYSGFTSPGPAYVNQRLFEFPAEPARALLHELGVRAVLIRDVSPAALDARLAAMPSAHTRVVAREPRAALVHVEEPAPAPPPAAVPLPRSGWTVTASPGETTVPAVLDGRRRTTWSVPGAGSTAPALTIDLGAVHTVAGIRCVAGGDPVGVYAAEVATSLDGTSWTPSDARFVPDSLATLFERPRDVRYWEARFPPRVARWVRLTNPRLRFWSGTWELAEVDVLARP